MSYKKMILMSVSILVLAGCAHKNAYLKEAQTVPPMVVPANIKMKPSENYYPVPGAPVIVTPPPQEPPGSNLQRFKARKNPPQALAQPTVTVASQTTELPPVAETSTIRYAAAQPLMVAQSENKLWVKVGRVLQHSSYQILDQDPTMGSYYVLDAKSTGNKLTESTPIYRIYLKPENDKTEILLLDKQNQPAVGNAAERIMTVLRNGLKG